MATALLRCRRAAGPVTARRIYLDNHATTPMDPLVLKAMFPYFREIFGNPGSSTHSFGWEAKDAVERGRAQVAEALDADADADEIVFTSGATESNNLALKGFAAASATKGHIITQATEHKCVLESVKRLAEEGWTATILPVDRLGQVDPDDLRRAIRQDTKLVTIMAANNEVGTLQPIRAIAEICRQHNIVYHTDAAQAVGKIALDLRDVQADMLSLSAHKIYGPKGVGALLVKGRGERVKLRRILDGGDQEYGLRAGTLPVPLIVGLGHACELAAAERAAEATRIQRLRDRLWDGIRDAIDDVVLNGQLAPKRTTRRSWSLSWACGAAYLLVVASLKRHRRQGGLGSFATASGKGLGG